MKIDQPDLLGAAVAESEFMPNREHLPSADPGREMRLGWLMLVLTAVLTAAMGRELAAALAAAEGMVEAAGQLLFMAILAVLMYGSVVYQLTRLGYFARRASFVEARDDELAHTYDADAGDLVVLVPSYREELDVVRRTLMSAALQDHPRRRVRLLIDDPPTSGDAADLAAMRALPQALQRLLDAAAAPLAKALAEFEGCVARGELDTVQETRRVAALHRHAAAWLRQQEVSLSTHVSGDLLYRDLVLRPAAEAHLAAAQELVRRAHPGGLSTACLRRQHQRLANRFRVELSSFERKRYVNLSHEPNKAMNLNSYLGLMGGSYREVCRADGVHLESAERPNATLVVPDAEFVITLDADSMIAPDYALRLIHEMRRPEHARTAVAQTPYSSIPARRNTLEYVAGATTDIQYLIHQGFTRFGATYWVGANALLRKAALEDIVVTQDERGFPVRLYIQDRTVIEDTESSVDLADKGWELFNYPQRVAYSATPPDFGALLIQRRRWANGGLIILPKLLRYLARGPLSAARLAEAFFRVHYLGSIAAVNLGLLIMLALPFETSAMNLIWLPLSSLPYFFLYGRDLTQIGYRIGDLLRVYALNLLLIPVNLGGVAKSLEQGLTGRKIPFGRTPKVQGRTAAPVLYILLEWGLLVWWLFAVACDVVEQRWEHALFGLANALLLGFAIVRYIGVRESLEDVRAAIAARRKPPAQRRARLAALHSGRTAPAAAESSPCPADAAVRKAA